MIITLFKNYPLEFIFSTINNRININVYTEKNFFLNELEKTVNKKYFIVPYLKNISDKFTILFNKYKMSMAFESINSLNNFIKTGKNNIELMLRCEELYIYYKISYQDCKAIPLC